jgi:NAD(P)-dependent dehydrogenase (short-subunit alcohol dehydrogenase family)/uncharacterized OB-fold protein
MLPATFKRKNPVLRTAPLILPPAARSRVVHGLTRAAALGRMELQHCVECGALQYPAREACVRCLSPQLEWRPHSGAGRLLTATTVRHSNELYFRSRVPWRVGYVQIEDGPCAMAFLSDAVPAPVRGSPPPAVRLIARLDRAGQAVLVALPADTDPSSETMTTPNDKILKETGCDPRGRHVLVTDGKSGVGQALVRALLDAGAETVWVGHAEPWKKLPGFAALAALPRVVLVPLDLTSERSVQTLAGEIGGKVDILVNNAEVNRARSIGARQGCETSRLEMETNFFGLLRLSQAFGPAMKARAADGMKNAVAWVNLLSVFALVGWPAQGTFAASKAAALSLAQSLRADLMAAGGVRVVNVFPGPIDDEWNADIPPPKVAPSQLASAVVRALVNGVEDVYPGDVAQEWLARWRENPKALEREAAQGVL